MEFSTEITFTQGGYALCFCNNPMVVAVTMSNNEFPAGSSAQQVFVVVEIGSNRHEYHRETANGETATFDISEAWRSEYAAHNKEITPQTIQSEVLEGRVKVHVSYIPDGELYTLSGSDITMYEHIFALRGGVSETDILLNGWTTPDMAVQHFRTNLSRKPNGKEPFCDGDKYMVSALDLTNVGLVVSGTGKLYVKTTITTIDANGTLPENVTIDTWGNRHLLLFENSFGVIESISCAMNEECLMKVTRQNMSTTGATSYVPDFGNIGSVTKDRMVWKMSSGYLSLPWRKWFVSEFMTARRHWFVAENGVAIPIEVSGDDSLKVYNAAKTELSDIEFTATAVVNGMV